MRIIARAALSIALCATGCGGAFFATGCAKVPVVAKVPAGDDRPVTRLVWYDVAAMDVIEILKGSCDGGRVSVRFLSFDQTQYPPRDKAQCRALSSYDIWNPGIWIMDFDSHLEPRFTVQRGNFVPMAKLSEVKAALGKTGTTPGQEKMNDTNYCFIIIISYN